MAEIYLTPGQKEQGDIAIVGMASHFPDANNLHEFWGNIISKRDSLTDINTMPAAEYWRKEDFYDPNVAAKDKTYGHKAGFVPAIDFDPIAFKIPPAIMDSISTAQLFSLYTAKQVMQDAGLLDNREAQVERDRIGVILGGGGNGNTSFSLAARQQTPYLREIMLKSGLSAEIADDVLARANELYLEWNEDSFPGFLGNVACGRIASYFDLGGTSYMVDAACASSLAAIKAAIGELNSGSCDAVLTGGVNLENSAFSFLCFSKTPALSKSNCSRPFDRDSDGIMLGDGVGLLMLKRLEDAELAGDRIYAVIKSLEASSDGRAKSIFAPRYEGQIKALKRAYARAAIRPGEIQLIEAHGTGTASGDSTELKSLRTVFDEQHLAAHSIAIGSIKSQIGHTRCAAGAASMIKMALALHQKVLPPSINVQQPMEALCAADSPFYLNSEARPWLRPLDGTPRRAALSAFGFGGTNFHAILEEYESEPHGAYRLNESTFTLLFTGDNPDQLLAQCERSLARFSAESAPRALKQHLAAQDINALQPAHARLLLVATSAAQARQLLVTAVEQLRTKRDKGWEHPLGIYFQPEGKALSGKVAALFPGQGSQYVNMARDIANDYPEMRRALEALDSRSVEMRGRGVSELIFPPPAFSAAECAEQRARLTDTANAQPAIGAVSAGYYAILKASGFVPDFVAGHSYGEVTALWAAGVLSDEDFYRVSLARGSAAAAAVAQNQGDGGAMLAASLTPEACQTLLSRYPDVMLANDNSPSQVVLGGASAQIQALYHELKASDVQCRILPVSAAFHTPFLQAACAPFLESLAGVRFAAPHTVTYSSASAARWPDDTAAWAEILAQQLIEPVRFRETIEVLYQRGARLFVEVGPKGVLGKLVADILQGREHTLISLNTSDTGEDRLQLARAQARLVAQGIPLNALDRHLRAAPVPDDPGGRLTCRLSGGFYLSEKNQRRRQHALREGDTRVVDDFIRTKQVITPAAPASAPAISLPVAASPQRQSITSGKSEVIHKRDQFMEQVNQRVEHSDDSPLHGVLQAQQVMSQLHQQFQANQQEYIQLLNSLLNKQYSLLENFRDHQNLSVILASLGQSVQLLDKNLELYHTNHERYFATQQSLFQPGQVAAPAAQGRQPPAMPAQAASQPLTTPAPLVPTAAALPVSAPASFSASVPSMPEMPTCVAPAAPEIAVAAQPAAAPAITDANAGLDAETAAQIAQFARITEADITARLVAIVSDRTGYPQDMIDVNMDLEADLGIDSIKRLEIFGAMFDAFSADAGIYHDASKNKDLETFDIEALSNIHKMSAFFKQMIDEIILDIRRKQGGEASETAADVADAKAFFIEDNQREKEETLSSEALRASEEIGGNAKLRTLGFVTSTAEVAEVEQAKKSLTESQQSAAPAVQAKAVSVLPRPQTQRFSVIQQILPLPDSDRRTFAAKRHWLVVDEGKTISEEVMKQLTAQGQTVSLLALYPATAKQKKQAKNAALHHLVQYDEAALDSAITKLERTHGAIDGLIWLQAGPEKAKDVAGVFSEKGYQSLETTFLLAKRLQASLTRDEESSGWFFVVSRGDGQLSLGQTGGLNGILHTAVSGLTKSLNAEWKNAFCRTLDIDASLKGGEAASILLQELQDVNRELAEVGRKAQGERMTLALSDAPTAHQQTPLALTGQDVLVVTGGARGITAQCVITLAQRTQAQFILLGRTDLNAPLPDWAQGTTTLNERKAKAIARLQAEGQQPTPVKIDAMLSGLLHRDDINATLSQVAEAGGKAIYRHCDITDASQVAAVLEEAQRTLGTVTGIIHGAGNLADKRIEKKTLADLRSVFDVKVRGLENLCRVLDITALKHLMLFSSVSGFFGNAGQTDYAMANEALNKFAWLPLQSESGLTVRAINWGPWDGGMVNETLKRAYEQHQMVVIPPETGTTFFVHEFTDHAHPQVIIGGNHYRAARRSTLPAEPLNVSRQLQLRDNPFLQHHVINHHPVLPATAAIAWMARACEEHFAGYRLQSVSHFTVLKGVVFDGSEAQQYHLTLTPHAGGAVDNNSLMLDITISSQSDANTMKHYQATLLLARQESAMQFAELYCDPDVAIPLPTPLYGDMTQGALLFHGEDFRGIQQLVHIDERSLVAKCCLPALDDRRQGQFPARAFNLFINDVGLQLPLLWLMQASDKAGLPVAIGRIEQFAPIEFNQTFYASMHIANQTATALLVDITLHDERGNVYSRFEQVKFTISTTLRALFSRAAETQEKKERI